VSGPYKARPPATLLLFHAFADLVPHPESSEEQH
jgi:hypothetical protein